MPTHNFEFYDGSPGANGFPTGTGFFNYAGPATKTGTGEIVDNGSGVDGQAFTDNDGTTGTFTINGNTSTNVSTEADGGYLLRDTVTGHEFRVVGVDVVSGPAAGTYTISERPLVPGRSYEVLDYEDDPAEGPSGTGFQYMSTFVIPPAR